MMRLQKFLALSGVASRRNSEKLIADGHVAVNGKVITEMGVQVDESADVVTVDGNVCKIQEEKHYLAYNKPMGEVTTVADPEGRPTVMDKFRDYPVRLYPVGRLDYDSEGLLLLTNDGDLMNNLLHPSREVSKEYLVKVSNRVTDEEIRQVEHIVNAKIRANIPLKEYRNIPIEEAKELGAIALFGEKYGDHVRVIQFGSSVEFCGGTHVAATGNIGMVKIISESSVAAGVRRIEAYTGARVEELMNTIEDTLRDLKALFNNAPDLAGTIRKYIDENTGLKKQVEDFMKEKEAQLKERLLKNVQEVNGVKVIKFCAPLPAETVKNIAFQLRGQITENLFFVAGTEAEGKPMLTVMLSDNLVAGGLKAGNLVKEAAKLIQGGGGGQPHFATAGGKNADGLNAAIDKVLELAGL